MNIVWLQASGCGGCTQSLLGDTARRGAERLAGGGLDLVAHPALSEASGEEALVQLRDIADGRLPVDILCIEGAMLRGPNGSGRFMLSGSGEPMIAWVRRLAAQAQVVVAVGSCNRFGGISAGGDNYTEACGLQFEGAEPGGLLGADFRARGACRWSILPAARHTPTGSSIRCWRSLVAAFPRDL